MALTVKPVRMLASSIAVLCGLVLIPGHAQTWNAVPASNNWNSAPNWTPANIPDNLGETAIFGASTITNPNVTSAIDTAERRPTKVGCRLSQISTSLKICQRDAPSPWPP